MGCWILSRGFLIRDILNVIFDKGTLDIEYLIRSMGYWIWDVGYWRLIFGFWVLDL